MKKILSSIFETITKRRFMLFAFSIVQFLTVHGQIPTEEFFKGLDLLSINKQEAKREFQTSLKKDSLFHGTYHFLGVIYLAENMPDSAIYCFKKSIALNKENLNHTKEMTYLRLISTYLYQHDFNNSFDIALDSYLQYPDNMAIKSNLCDACLWSFYINHNNLDRSYLSPDLKEEYLVNSVDEEYLILRWIRIGDHYLVVNSQSLITKKKISYDMLKCNLSESNENVDVKFRLNWDLDKYFGGKVSNMNDVYNNTENPIYERIGALLVSNPKIDLTIEIKKLIK